MTRSQSLNPAIPARADSAKGGAAAIGRTLPLRHRPDGRRPRTRDPRPRRL